MDSPGHWGSDSSDGADESVESQSQTQHDLPDDNPHIAAEPTVATLLDLAVKVTAKHLSCEEIEHRQPLLDDRLLKKVPEFYAKLLQFWGYMDQTIYQ